MAEKLYPPIIDTALPPIEKITKKNGNRLDYKITVPFGYNGLVSRSDVSNISIRICDPITNEEIIKQLCSPESLAAGYTFTVKDIINEVDRDYLIAGNFYKIQIAFISKYNYDENTDVEGYYSSYGVAKCIDRNDFSIVIKEFDEAATNTLYNLNKFTGVYTSQDKNEIVNKYEFNIYKQNELVESSSITVHNNSIATLNRLNDAGRISYDTYNLVSQTEDFIQYRIEYVVYTNNGLILKSEPYYFTNTDLNLINLKGDIEAINNLDNGCIEIYSKNLESSMGNSNLVYNLYRSDERGNFLNWEHIYSFAWKSNETIEEFQLIYKDYFIEQGIDYKYAISAIMPQIETSDAIAYQSNKLVTDVVNGDFEELFLIDGDRQLSIKYNPKVANFKTTKLEQKTDTIGGIYPYFNRNYNTNYKELSISGLISILIDEQELFIKGFEGGEPSTEPYRASTAAASDQGIPPHRKTDLVSVNFKTERQFKLDVLDWLNNGEYKVFKSSAEGNYIVRLMNVSLSPTDSLGRMLHTFSCTAYEVDEYNIDNLIKYNFIKIPSVEFDSLIIEDIQSQGNSPYVFDLSKYHEIQRIDCNYFPLGAKLVIYHRDTSKSNEIIYIYDENQVILLNNVEDVIRIEADGININPKSYIIVYCRKKDGKNQLSIEKIQYDFCVKQYISETYDGISNVSTLEFSNFFNDFNPLKDNKQYTRAINKIIVRRRSIEEISNTPSEEVDNTPSWANWENLTHYTTKELNSLKIYHYNNNYYTQDIYGVFHEYSNLNYSISLEDNEGNTYNTYIENSVIENSVPQNDIRIISINTVTGIQLNNLKSLNIGNGLYCEVYYPVIRIRYKGEQSWRDEDEDNGILCGYKSNSIYSIMSTYDDESHQAVIVAAPLENNNDNNNIYYSVGTLSGDTTEKLYIGLNCYNLINANDYEDYRAVTEQTKTRENGKYLSDRGFITDLAKGQVTGI